MDILGSTNVSTKQERIAMLAKQSQEMCFTSLNHHLDIEWLSEAYRRTRKSGAVGIDQQTAEDYKLNLESNLKSLLERVKSGTYFAPSVKRVYIPKGAGSKELRPIGIPTFEDKVLQRAIVMLLEPIYEADFLDCSYGFRPKRSQHQALENFRDQIMDIKGGRVLCIDISKFFDTLSKTDLRKFIEHRVRDGVVLRLIGKWLNAGVFEDGITHYPEDGSPQGGVISPLLSNVYLHYVLDLWFTKVVQPRLRGRASLVRFADDALIVFSNKEDAEKFMDVLPKRFTKFGLKVHPTKTVLVNFHRPTAESQRLSETFDFLGFTHYWTKSRRGFWVIKRKTAKDRLRRALVKIAGWCRENRHKPRQDQHKILSAKLRGHYNYYGIRSNHYCLRQYLHRVVKIWRKWLSRRSQKGYVRWDDFNSYLCKFPLPQPKIRRSA